MRGNNKVFVEACSLILLHQLQAWWKGREICNVFEINNNEMFLSFFRNKELESVVPVNEKRLHKKIQKKEFVFVDLNFSLTFAKHFIISIKLQKLDLLYAFSVPVNLLIASFILVFLLTFWKFWQMAFVCVY